MPGFAPDGLLISLALNQFSNSIRSPRCSITWNLAQTMELIGGKQSRSH